MAKALDTPARIVFTVDYYEDSARLLQISGVLCGDLDEVVRVFTRTTTVLLELDDA